MRIQYLYKYGVSFLCFLGLIFCAVMQFRFALHEQNVVTGKSGGNISAFTRDPGLLTFSAKQKHLFEGDMDGSLSLLQKALIHNPFYVPAWLGLAELNNDKGDKQSATKIINYVHELTHDIKWWRWEKALTAYQLGRTELLPDELRFIIREIPGKNRNVALQLAFRLWEDPNDLLDKVGSENLLHLFNFSVRKKYHLKATFFWDTMQDEGTVCPEKNSLAFLNMLLGVGEISTAGDIWRKHFAPETLLYNGNFSTPFLRTAFGWRPTKHKGFVYSLEWNPKNNNKDLYYRFKGWDNLSFHHLYQIVPLKGGKEYRLAGEFKTHKLTTDQRPFLEVYGYKCKMDYSQTKMVAAEQDWQEHSLRFIVPESCDAVVVRLRRKESFQIDNKLSGKLWLSNLEIIEIGEVVTSVDEQQQ